MKSNRLIWMALILPLIFLCCKKNVNVTRVVYENETQYQIELNDSVSVYIGLTPQGSLYYFLNELSDNRTQVVSFCDDGTIKTKQFLNEDKLQEGRVYSFYKHYGALSSDYNYINGVKTGSAIEYHLGTDRIKKILLYNEKGELTYFKEFDSQGNLIKTEGTPILDDLKK